ncbi:MAG TPA: CopG family transcriptional regulator [Myxococcales bacterium]|nr:CopG family transcriptional regulator [Myxococcales bacterium]
MLDAQASARYMDDKANTRRTTIVIPADDERALRAASRAEGVSQSELIRRGIRAVTAAYRRARPRPRMGLFKATKEEREDLLYGPDEFGDVDA